MQYNKPSLGLDQLVAHLQALGLEGEPASIAHRVQDVGYYRLSPYWRFFRLKAQAPDSRLAPGTTIEDVWRIYTFDRELRLLVLDAVERVEIAIRARLVQEHVRAHGPFGYAAGTHRAAPTQPGRVDHYAELLLDGRRSLERARGLKPPPQVSEALRHFALKYGDCHGYPPLWLAAETFSFGDLVTLYRGSPTPVRKAVARSFDVADPVLQSWLLTLQTVRNTCAHHGRLWNRVSRITPVVSEKDAAWQDSALGRPDRTFFTLTILAHLVGIVCDGSQWANRYRDLVNVKYPTVPRAPMGMGEAWERNPIWARRLAVR